MTLLRFVHWAIVLAAVFGGSLASQSSDQDLENLRNHLSEIRAILDETSYPCGNFPKYACGNYQNSSDSGNYPDDRVYLSDIADEVNRLTDFKLEATQKAKDFLKSCQDHQTPKDILTKVDMFKNPKEFKLAKTLGILKASSIDSIISTNINTLDLNTNKLRVIISLDSDLFLANEFNERQIQRNLELLEVNPTEREDAAKKINDFIQKGRSILVQSEDIPMVGHDVNAIKNFDWDEYLTELKKLPKLGQATLEFILEDVVNLQKIIDLTHETDVEVLRLVTALEYMAEVDDYECDSVVDFFRLPIFAEFYRLYFNASDKSFILDVLNEFEKSHSTIGSKVESLSGGALARVQEKRKIIDSMDQILDPTQIDAEYKNILIEKDNFYQNYLYLTRFKLYKFLSRENSNDEIAEQYLLNILNPVNRMKPMFYQFTTQGLYLWQLFFRESRPKFSYDMLRDCLDDQQNRYKLFEFNDFDYFYYVEQFAAMKQAYIDFKRNWDSEYDPTHKLDSVFREFHLTSDQVFFLNVAQRECTQVYNGKNIPFRIMLNLEEVSKAFNCPAGSQLNIDEKCSAW